MIEYKVLESTTDKESIKAGLKVLFSDSFNKELSEDLWYHIIQSSPFESSLLVVALDGNKVVGCSNMIPQKLNTSQGVLDYFLFTTSIVDMNYRSKGVYLELIKLMKVRLKESGKKFIFAFPNKKAAPIITSSFFGFKKITEFSLVNLNLLQSLSAISVEKSILIDDDFLSWRLSHNEYFLTKTEEFTLLCKAYESELDVLEVFDQPKETALLEKFLDYKEIEEFNGFNISSDRIQAEGSLVNPLIAVMYSDDKAMYDLNIDVSLLAWDVI